MSDLSKNCLELKVYLWHSGQNLKWTFRNGYIKHQFVLKISCIRKAYSSSHYPSHYESPPNPKGDSMECWDSHSSDVYESCIAEQPYVWLLLVAWLYCPNVSTIQLLGNLSVKALICQLFLVISLRWNYPCLRSHSFYVVPCIKCLVKAVA